jgi:hypothetical protein
MSDVVSVTADEPTGVIPPPFTPIPTEPSPSVLATAAAGPATEMITCPECGTTALVTLNHRQSQDFCRNCDYPLFWVPTRVVLGRDGGGEAALRRLPGTVGRATIAALACPHCDEPNAVTATVCVRCGLSLHPVALPPPPPPPVYVAPAPVPEPEVMAPEPGWPWWVWALICVVGAAAIGVVTYLILANR